MEVTSIQNGIIIDHVPAGTALKVLEYLKIDPSKTKLALICLLYTSDAADE